VPTDADTTAGTVRVLAGECTVRFEGSRERTQRGHVVVLIKPDRTTLVHDAEGYQPATVWETTRRRWSSVRAVTPNASASASTVSESGRVSHAAGW